MNAKKNELNSDIVDSPWKVICRIGGIAAIIFIVYSLVTFIVLFKLGAGTDTVLEYYTLLHNNRIEGLLKLDILTAICMPLYYLLFFGIYAALRKTEGALTALGTIFIFIGVTLFLATPSVFSMAYLSDQYAAAITDSQRSQLLAAGEAVMASDMWHGTGARIGGFIIESAALFISFVMFRSKVFGKLTAYVGIITNGLDLIHIIVNVFQPGIGSVLMAISGTLYLAWFPLLAWRLLQLGHIDRKGIS